jgi:hypothetical protein
MRRIQAGTKTQTRRVVTPQPGPRVTSVQRGAFPDSWIAYIGDYGVQQLACSLGGIGDIYWLREPIRNVNGFVQYVSDEVISKHRWPGGRNYRLARWMPEKVCRFEARAVDIRVERLQSISIEDARAEGFVEAEAFFRAWDATTMKDAEKVTANPWVWASAFIITKGKERK